jgi:hypothetical protein
MDDAMRSLMSRFDSLEESDRQAMAFQTEAVAKFELATTALCEQLESWAAPLAARVDITRTKAPLKTGAVDATVEKIAFGFRDKALKFEPSQAFGPGGARVDILGLRGDHEDSYLLQAANGQWTLMTPPRTRSPRKQEPLTERVFATLVAEALT